jgi:translation initiation factor 3 subunit G
MSLRSKIKSKFGRALVLGENTCRPSEEEIYLESSQTLMDDDEQFFMECIEQSYIMEKPVMKYKARGLDEEEGSSPVDTPSGAAPSTVNGSGKYVAPRGGAAFAAERDDRTLRVTNLSETVKEGDLSELFSKAGRVQRVFVAKHLDTKACKGFAFVSMVTKEGAEKAIELLHGHGYDHLILRVEWAKPSSESK